MRILNTTLTFLSLMVFLAPTAVAEDEKIGDPLNPVFAVFGQPIDLDYLNIIHPAPHRKVMSFTGMAQASGAPGIPAILGIHFDYIDPNNPTGPPVVIPSPNFYMEAVQTGAGYVQINAGPVQLPFCPDQVSIHFENLTEFTEIEFYGTFNHTCVPIPEPTTASLVLLCGVASLGWRRRLG